MKTKLVGKLNAEQQRGDSRRAIVCIGDSYSEIEKCSSDLYTSFLDPIIK